MEFILNNLEETQKVANNLASEVAKTKNDKATVIGLYGELGAGKTTFMKYFAEALGIEETIQSPTFVIERIYSIPADSSQLKAISFSHLIHIDAYRLDSAQELEKLGWQTLISDPNNLICIEWPERAIEIMPPHIVVRFEHGEGEKQRKISIA